MTTAVIMPRQGQSVESCILTEIKVRKGDGVTVGQLLFAYETDKAAFEELSRVEGEVLEVFFAEGDEVPVLSAVMVVGCPGESVADAMAEAAEVSPRTTSLARDMVRGGDDGPGDGEATRFLKQTAIEIENIEIL